jgi:ABC-type sugar transport system substrate-binding protein
MSMNKKFQWMGVSAVSLLISASTVMVGAQATTAQASATPKWSNLVIGFSQSESLVNPFRMAETKSIQAEAKRLGVKRLIVTDANSQEPKQISDIRQMIAEGVNALIVAPLDSTGLQPVFTLAKQHHIPVFEIDRQTTGTAGSDYVTFMGSNFLQQAIKAADALDKATGGHATVAVLEGSLGNGVTTDRTNGFETELKKYPGMHIVAVQSGNFVRATGQQVMQQLISAHPTINAVYAENDEMALGAIPALVSAGKTPGKNVKIVSIDGEKAAMQAIVKGQIAADVQTNPRFGPLAFQEIFKYLSGDKIPGKVIQKDNFYDSSNVSSELASGQGY